MSPLVTRAARRSGRAARIAILALAVMPCSGLAAQSARLEVSLTPEHLGQGTTVEFGFDIAAIGGGVPSPVTQIDLRYPKHLGIATGGLGIASCTTTFLSELGPEGCPSQSLMGYGTATAEIQGVAEIIEERAITAVFMAPLAKGNINLAFYVNGKTPLAAYLLFPGLLLPAAPPYGGDLAITVPLLESFPNGPDVALVKLRSTIGPLGVTYYEHIHHEFVPYQPSGIILPSSCPSHGFPFAVSFAFADGSHTTSRATVPCPHAPRRRPGAAAAARAPDLAGVGGGR
jgi:hypothetical protein